MSQSPSQAISHRPVLVALALLLLITGSGVFKATVEDLDLGEVPPTTASLSVDEATYYRFVAPRLNRLVVEVDRTAVMVDDKSRDIMALTVSGSRIEALADEIVQFGEHNGVPERFGHVHQHIRESTGIITDAFDEARSALSRFDFSAMTGLVQQFNEAARLLHLAQDEMIAIVGNDSALTAQGY